MGETQNMKKLPFAVVEDKDKALTVVATKWIIEAEKKYYYPQSTKTLSTSRMVMMLKDPEKTWDKYDYINFHKYNTYALATKAIRKFADKNEPLHSNVETDYNCKRVGRKPKKYGIESESEFAPSSSEDDSQLEVKEKERRSVNRNNQRKRIVNSSDDEEEDIPPKRQKKGSSKLLKPIVNCIPPANEDSIREKVRHMMSGTSQRRPIIVSKSKKKDIKIVKGGISKDKAKATTHKKLSHHLEGPLQSPGKEKLISSSSKGSSKFSVSDQDTSSETRKLLKSGNGNDMVLDSKDDNNEGSQHDLAEGYDFDQDNEGETSDQIHASYSGVLKSPSYVKKTLFVSTPFNLSPAKSLLNTPVKTLVNSPFKTPRKSPAKSLKKSPPKFHISPLKFSFSSSSKSPNKSFGTSKALQKSPSLKYQLSPRSRVKEQDIVKLIHGLKADIAILQVDVTRILEKLYPEETAKLKRPTSMPPIPIADEAGFEKYENYLENDSHFAAVYELMTRYIKNDVNEDGAATKLLRTWIGPGLSKAISWKGTGGTKITFQTTRLLECIQCATIKKFGDNVDFDVAISAIKRWFNVSSNRSAK